MPLAIAASGASKGILATGGPDYGRLDTWLAVLGLYDLVFALIAYAVFDFLVED
jgi:heme exporter protein B